MKARQDFMGFGARKKYVLPAAVIFLIPVFSWFFFRHAEARYDARIQNTLMGRLNAPDATNEEKMLARVLEETPMSRLLREDERAAAMLKPTVRRDYAIFRWMKGLAAVSVRYAFGTFALAAICVALSLRSQRILYWNLLRGWHYVRIYAAVHAIVIAILLAALSFWITALWFDFYASSLIVAGLVGAFVLAVAAITTVFQRLPATLTVSGAMLERDDSPLWTRLRYLAGKSGAEPPEQVIVGTDGLLFVTEVPVALNGDRIQGRTLYMSLPLLRQLSGSQTEALISHELAHFRGADDYYSRKISPLLVRFDALLESLYDGAAAPIFYFMICFRAIIEMSVRKWNVAREIRADQAAIAATSPRDLAGALLNAAAFSKLQQEKTRARLRSGEAAVTLASPGDNNSEFRNFAASFASNPALEWSRMEHPVDRHAKTFERLSAVGLTLRTDEIRRLLAIESEENWLCYMPDADELERQLRQSQRKPDTSSATDYEAANQSSSVPSE